MILGAGMTGLAAGWVSGLPVYEAEDNPGGICSSYYVQPGSRTRLHEPPPGGEAYRFEIGGGHWIFGGDSLTVQFIRSISPVKSYVRKSSVFLPDGRVLVPYPLQNNLKYLPTEMAQRALCEMAEAASQSRSIRTMADWLRDSFGQTLCQLFFDPFHRLYTAGLWQSIAPQDSYKSPVNLSLAIQGTFNHTRPVGYNTTFIYPEEGLNALTRRMAARCNVRYNRRVICIDIQKHQVVFSDGVVPYERLISTLPLNRTMQMAELHTDARPDPSSAVLVINIGARKGKYCPEDHWVYLPTSNCDFHRVGFYSHVDASFLPASARTTNDRVSIYVEKSYPEGHHLSREEMDSVGRQVVRQLQEWEWIADAEVVDPTWIDVAYTWSWPGSHWKQEAIKALEAHGIYQIGRYARWSFQGIADSIRDGMAAGGAVMTKQPREAAAQA